MLAAASANFPTLRRGRWTHEAPLFTLCTCIEDLHLRHLRSTLFVSILALLAMPLAAQEEATLPAGVPPFASIDVEASFHGASLVGNSLYTATWQGATVVRNALGSLSLGKYGDYEFSRTFAGEAPRGLAALLPAAACDAPKSLDGELQETGRYRIDRDGEDAR